MGYRLENIKQPSVNETSEGHARPSTETKKVKTESPTVTASLSWELWKFNQVVNFIYWYAEISCLSSLLLWFTVPKESDTYNTL